MKSRALLTAALLLIPAGAFAASKETLELQRDVAQVQEDVRQLQRSFDREFSALKTMTQQSLDTSNRSATQVSVLERVVRDEIAKQMAAALAPMAGLSTKIDQLGNHVNSLGESIQELNASMARMQTQLTDINNKVQALQVPVAPPPPAPNSDPSGAVVGPGPIVGGPVTQDQTRPAPPPMAVLYQNGKRDMESNKPDIALAEFRDFVTYYPESDLAPNSQFYIAWIRYSRNELEDAIREFDVVLEKYPKNTKTADAFYYKGVSLLKLGRSPEARKEFNAVILRFPKTEAASKAADQLKNLGFKPPSAAPARPSAARR